MSKMTNLNINKDFTVHPRAKAPREYCEGYTLADVYNRYSRAKENAFEYCRELCNKYNGWGLCISSHNSQCFTVMFNFEHPENGRTMVAKITRDYNHAYYCQLENGGRNALPY